MMVTENNGIFFTELTLQNVRCFGKEAVLKLSNNQGDWSRWNVILGDNGTGKTTLLQCLAGMTFEKYNSHSAEHKGEQQYWGPKLFNEPSDISFLPIDKQETVTQDYVNGKSERSVIKAQIINGRDKSKITIGVSQFYNVSKENLSHYTPVDKFLQLFILGYGANRRISFQILSEKESEPDNSQTLFDDDAKLINAEEWLYQMDYSAVYAESRDTKMKEYAKQRRDLVFKVISEIMPDVEEISTSIEGSPAIPVIKFKTPYGWVRIRELSYGYKTMAAWIIDVAARMFKHYPTSPNPLEEPVIILVDEIDLHLHPKWQRQIFDFLEKRFPRAQFIVTAHSPLIVQSAPKDANIVVLKKEKVEDGYVVKIDNDIESVRNWRIDQIMTSDLFGVESARSPEIEKKLEERKALLQKDDLTDADKARLEELNKFSNNLPTAENKEDIEAMEIIRKAAEYLKGNQTQHD